MSASPLNKHLKKALLHEDGSGGGQRKAVARRGSFLMALKLKPEPTMPKSRRRTFSALQARQYEGPAIYDDTYKRETEQQTALDRSKAVFVDGRGQCYNLLYEAVDSPFAEGSDNGGVAALQEFPSPDNFQDFTDFNQAVSQWYSRAQAALGDLVLPDVLGRAYKRPRIGISLHAHGEESTEESSTPVSTDEGLSLEKRDSMGDTDEEDLFEKGWTMDSDPWGSVLVPQEPSPSAYATFEEYEAALQNWACLCSCSLPIIPPHPSQLESIILLQTAETRQKNEKLRARKAMLASLNAKDQMFVLEREEHQPIVGVRWLKERDCEVDIQAPPLELPTFKNAELERSFNASEETVDHCRGMFHSLANERYQLLQRTGAFNEPLRAQPHFIGPQSTLLYQSTPPAIHDPPTVSTNWPLWRTFPQTPDDFERATLYQPFHRLDHLDRKRLGQAEYLHACEELVRELQHAQRYDKHYSWYHKEASDKSGSKTVALLNQATVSAKDLGAAVCGPEYLDEFHLIMHSLDSTCIQQLVDSFSSTVKADTFASYLRLVDSIREERAICKLNLVIVLCLPTHIDSFLGPMVEKQQNELLYRLAKAITHFSAVPQEIYPFNATTILHVGDISPSIVPVVQKNLTMYYMQVITNYLQDNPTVYINMQLGMKRMLAKAQQSLQAEFNHAIQYFRLLGHRSTTVSHLFLVLILSLLRFDPTSPIGELVSSCGIAYRLRELALSRFTHVRKTALSVVLAAMKTTLLRNVFTQFYSRSVDQFVEEVSAGNHWSSVLLGLAIEDLRSVQSVSSVDMGTLTKYKHVLQTGRSKTAFHVLWNSLKTDIKCEKRHSVEVARFLVVTVATAAKLSMICGLDRLDRATDKGSLQFHSSDLLEMMSFIADRSAPVTQRGYLVRANLLKVVSTITFNLEEPLEGALQSAQFFQALVVSLKDGADRAFNRLAWIYFYTLVKSKNDVVASMDSKGMLGMVFELISPTTNPIVLAHCLQHIGELLTLYKKESKKVQRKEHTARGEADLRTLERDIKVISLQLVKHVVKVHFIYKRIKHDNTSGYVNSALVRFYGAVARVKNLTSIGGSKVYKEFTKNKEYLANMNEALSAFNVTIK